MFLFYACGLYGSHMTTKAADACAQALRALERKMLKGLISLRTEYPSVVDRLQKVNDHTSVDGEKFSKPTWMKLFQFYLIFLTETYASCREIYLSHNFHK